MNLLVPLALALVLEGPPASAGDSRVLCAAAEAAVPRAVRFLDRRSGTLRLDVVSLLRFIEGAWPASGAGAVAERAKAAAMADPTYPAFSMMIDRPFRPLPPRPLDGVERPAPSADPGVPFDEERSDRCLQQALRCRFTPECAADESRDAGGYTLSHQVLYHLFATMQSCPTAPDHGRALDRRAARMYREHLSAAGVDDLFVERMGIGAFAGYRRFLRPDWLRAILAAQRPSGCWRAAGSATTCNDHTTGMAALVLSLFLAASNPDGCRE